MEEFTTGKGGYSIYLISKGVETPSQHSRAKHARRGKGAEPPEKHFFRKKNFPLPRQSSALFAKSCAWEGVGGGKIFPRYLFKGGLRGLRCHFGRSWTRPTGAQDPSRQARRWPGDAGPEGVAFREIPSPLFPSAEGEGRQPAPNAGGEAGSYGAVLRRKPQCASCPAGATRQFFGELSFKKAPTLAHRNGVTFARRPPWGETKKGDGFPCPTTHTGWNLPGK